MAKGGPTSEDLIASLGRGDVAPVYLIYGEEDFLASEALDAVLTAALAGTDRTFNLDVISGEEVDGREIVARASSFPMGGGRRVVVVRETDRLSVHDLEVLSAYASAPSPSACLVLLAVKPDMRKNPFATIRKSGGAFECRRLYENQVPSWIAAQVRGDGRRIGPEAAKLLTACTGTSLREIRSELDKLEVYAGAREEITAADVAALVGMSKEYTPFELQKAVGMRDTPRAMTILAEILETGGMLPFVFTTMTNYFLTLLKLHDLRRRGVGAKDLASQAKVNPYFMPEYLDALACQEPGACERALLSLAEADERSKSGSEDARRVMEELVIRLCGAEAGNIAGSRGV